MKIKNVFYYLFYMIARHAPTSKMRIIFLKKIPHVKLGEDCYLGPDLTLIPICNEESNLNNISGGFLLSIGDRVAISPNVTFLCTMNPEKSKLSKIYGKTARIIVEEDVWIGAGSIILAGIKIHKCSVIGAGAVVTKDVGPHSVVAGSPARLIKNLNSAMFGE